MSRLFDPENKFWNFIGKIADVTCMSFLWVGTSLPLVTMGAATTAFYSYTMHQVRDTEGGILSGYFKAFRHNFKKATLLWRWRASRFSRPTSWACGTCSSFWAGSRPFW